MLDVREIAPGLVAVSGTVDLTSVAELREKLGEAVERAIHDGMPTLSVDLHEVDLVDAAGLGVLLGAHRRARRGGARLRLVRLSPELSRVLLVSRLYRVLDVEHGEAAEGVPGPREGESEGRPMASS